MPILFISYIPTAGTFVTQGTTLLCCAYCQGQHYYSASCDKFKDVKAHKDILLKSGRCFRQTNHKLKDFHCPKTCSNCHQWHHQSICSGLSPEAEPFVPQTNTKKAAAAESTKDYHPFDLRNTFEDAQHKARNCNSVWANDVRQIKLKYLSSCNFPIICSNLAPTSNVTQFSHLMGLQLADNLKHAQDTIDVLVGWEEICRKWGLASKSWSCCY